MTQQNPKADSQVNELEIGEEVENPSLRTQTGVFLKKPRRRRLDLLSLPGTLRESARIYREFANGLMSAGELEIRSRHLRRHSEIVSASKQAEQLAAIQQQLEQLAAQRLGTSIPFAADDLPLLRKSQ
jgi:hypothetical protein